MLYFIVLYYIAFIGFFIMYYYYRHLNFNIQNSSSSGDVIICNSVFVFEFQSSQNAMNRAGVMCMGSSLNTTLKEIKKLCVQYRFISRLQEANQTGMRRWWKKYSRTHNVPHNTQLSVFVSDQCHTHLPPHTHQIHSVKTFSIRC